MAPKIVIRSSQESRYRTCCNIWHIRTGTALLGVMEMAAVAILFSGVVRQLMWKNRGLKLCMAK